MYELPKCVYMYIKAHFSMRSVVAVLARCLSVLGAGSLYVEGSHHVRLCHATLPPLRDYSETVTRETTSTIDYEKKLNETALLQINVTLFLLKMVYKNKLLG